MYLFWGRNKLTVTIHSDVYPILVLCPSLPKTQKFPEKPSRSDRPQPAPSCLFCDLHLIHCLGDDVQTLKLVTVRWQPQWQAEALESVSKLLFFATFIIDDQRVCLNRHLSELSFRLVSAVNCLYKYVLPSIADLYFSTYGMDVHSIYIFTDFRQIFET